MKKGPKFPEPSPQEAPAGAVVLPDDIQSISLSLVDRLGHAG